MQTIPHLRKDTLDFIRKAIDKMTDEEFKTLAHSAGYSQQKRPDIFDEIIEEPAAFLLKAGILEYPELLCDTVIELDDHVDYLIDRDAAEALKTDQPRVKLRRLWDNQTFQVGRKKIVAALTHHCTFDQL